MKTFEGKLVSEGIKVGIVCARFNEFIVSKLLSGCEDTLLHPGQYLTLRLCVQRGVQGRGQRGAEQRHPRHVRRPDH